MKHTIKREVGIGWCGAYIDGTLGWQLPQYLSKYGEPPTINQKQALGLIPNSGGFAPSDMYRVRITVEPIKNKRGAYIVRRTKRSKP